MGLSYEIAFKGNYTSIELHNITHVQVEEGVYKLYREGEIFFSTSVDTVLYIKAL